MISIKRDEECRCFGLKKIIEYDENGIPQSKMRCNCLIEQDEFCGTPNCPFFKPIDKSEWIRVDQRELVNFYSPDEVKYLGEIL